MNHTLLTVSQAAKLKGLSRGAIYAAISRKSLPARLVLGHLAVREADLLAWDASKSKGGRPQGKLMSAEAKAKLSESQKRRWAQRKQQTTR